MATPNDKALNTLLEYAKTLPGQTTVAMDWEQAVKQMQADMAKTAVTQAAPGTPFQVALPQRPHRPMVMKVDEQGVTSDYTGKVLVLYYVAMEPSDGYGLPRFKVKPFRLPLGSASAHPGMNEMRMSMPTQLFETEAEAQRECVTRVREVYRGYITQFVEQMVLASFESGACDTPETTLVEALKSYLESIK